MTASAHDASHSPTTRMREGGWRTWVRISLSRAGQGGATLAVAAHGAAPMSRKRSGDIPARRQRCTCAEEIPCGIARAPNN